MHFGHSSQGGGLIPKDKIQATIYSPEKLRRQNPVQLNPLNQAVGKAMFIAQLIPVL